jgi:hypothetical protein
MACAPSETLTTSACRGTSVHEPLPNEELNLTVHASVAAGSLRSPAALLSSAAG